MMAEDTKISMTILDLQRLLQEQKEITAESICVAVKKQENNTTDTAIVRNSARTSPYPKDFQILKKYL